LAKFGFLKENRLMYVFKAILLLCLHATCSCIFVNNANWSIEGNLTLYIGYRIHIISPIGSVVKQTHVFLSLVHVMGLRFSICTTVDYILWRQGQLLNQKPEAYHQMAAIFYQSVVI
jgi:hypothetical protein